MYIQTSKEISHGYAHHEGPTYIESKLFVNISQAFICRDPLEMYAQA